MPIYVPKRVHIIKSSPVAPIIFLAGPIRGGNDWQAEAAENLLAINNRAHVISPCRWDGNHRLAEHFVNPFVSSWNDPRQRRWEEIYLQQAALDEDESGCALFWLPKEDKTVPRNPEDGPYAMDTWRELGKIAGWFHFNKNVRMVIGGDPDFPGLDTILDDLCVASRSAQVFFTDMQILLLAAMQTAV